MKFLRQIDRRLRSCAGLRRRPAVFHDPLGDGGVLH
jgi:hypothetical protein